MTAHPALHRQDTNGDTYAYDYAYCYTNSNINADTYANVYAYTYTNSNADACTYTNPAQLVVNRRYHR